MKKPLVICVAVLAASAAFAADGHKQVAEGNRLFAEEKYDEANNRYRDALLQNPESPIVNFNIGDVHYKKRNYEEAIKYYEKTLSAEDVGLQSQSYYNIGNALYKMGQLPESILAYKKALELNPDDEDAKYNLEYVRAKLKEQSEKQPQQNQQQQEQQESEQEQSQGEQNPEQQNNQQQQEQNQQEQERENPEEQQQEQSAAEQQNEQQPAEEHEQQMAEQPEDISKEDAERILNALQNEEGDLLKQQRPKAKGRPFRGKDW